MGEENFNDDNARMSVRKRDRLGLALALISLFVAVVGVALNRPDIWKPGVALSCLSIPIALGCFSALRSYRFTAWIVASFVAAMTLPEHLQTMGGFDLHHPWLKLAMIQSVMFGMGTQMRIADLAGILRSPLPVAIGLLCQFSIMPLVGFGLAKCCGLSPEIAAGVVLIGSCSSGLSSNVMVCMSRGNLALSVTLTTVATLLAPLITPMWMTLLAGQFVEVKFLSMMLNIIKIVVVPIGAAFVHDFLRQSNSRIKRFASALALAALVWIVVLAIWQSQSPLPESSSTWLILTGFICGALVVGYGYHQLATWIPQVEKLMPGLSMLGIVYFTLITTVAGREDLLTVGITLFFVAIVHNSLGFMFGYGLSRLMGLGELSARAVALEVGLQNGGMASGLADAMGKLGTVGLAPAIFSPWMNVSGSVLANYWRKRPPASETKLEESTESP